METIFNLLLLLGGVIYLFCGVIILYLKITDYKNRNKPKIVYQVNPYTHHLKYVITGKKPEDLMRKVLELNKEYKKKQNQKSPIYI